MTDINTRGKLPFTIVSSSVNTGYATQLTSSVGYNIDIVNHHKDEYGAIENSPLQGPFTAQHVGGNQHRHVKLNDGSDDSDSRPEAYIISASAGSVRIYGPDVNGIHKPRSLLTRDTTAKSPVNIKNIQTSGNVAGNFEHNYQVVQSVGRRITNNLIVDGFEASGNLTTQFITGSHNYTLPDIIRIDAEGKQYKDQTTFVERFNAPGGKEVSSRGALDREGEEYAPNNSLTTRNIGVRQPYYDRLTQHSVKPFLSKLNFLDTSIVFRNVSPALSLTFGNDGLSLYTTSTDKTYQFNLTKKYDVSTAEYRGVLAIPVFHGAGIAFDDTGNFLYQASSITGIIKLYTLSVPWDISTAVFTSDLTGFNTNISGILFADNGNKFYTISSTTKIIKCYTLATQWAPNSADPSTTYTDTSDMQICTGIAVKNDGKNIYVTDRYNGNVYDYTLSAAHDVSTAILTEKHFLGATGAENFDLFLEPQTNQKLFILDRSNDRLDCYINFINDYVTEEKINKNSITRIEQVKGRNGETYATSSVNDNFWVQHAIPRTDLRYKWIADSVSSSQQPIEYQSYNLPYSISNSYNSNGAFTDLSFEQKGPFGDHLGISGAIDKDEMHVSTYTNTMYRDRKCLKFVYNGGQSIDLGNISQDISKKDFTISLWFRLPSVVGVFNDYGYYDFISYNTSYGRNQICFSSSYVYPLNAWVLQTNIPQSTTDTTELYKLNSNYSDDIWHMLSVVVSNEKSLSGTSQALKNSVRNKIYIDGGLVHESIQKNIEFEISQLTVGAGVYSGNNTWDNTLIDNIDVWNIALSAEQALETFRISKSAYGKKPRKYIEHKYNNISELQPKNCYSSRVDKNNNILFDEISNKNATLVGFTAQRVEPQSTGIISYSTYFNGPYQGASWKSIRNAEHPVTRKLTTDNTNIVSVVIPEGPKVITRVIRGTPVRITVPGNRKQGTILNVKESPVYTNNKPLRHKFILKDSQNINVGFELTHTYANNLQYFASNQLNLTLGLDKKERQIYDSLLEYYNGSVEANENPIDRLVGYTYSETIFPKPGQALLKDVRQRTDYITDQPGYSIDGYDRQLGTQRAFWRDSQEDRKRTRRNYITSLGDQLESVYDLPFQTPSIAALEYISEGNSLEHYSTNILLDEDVVNFSPTRTGSFIDISYKNAAELNNSLFYMDVGFGTTFTGAAYFNLLIPSFSIPEIYFFKNASLTTRDQFNVVLTSSLYPLQTQSDPSSLRLTPKLVFEHCSFIFSQLSTPGLDVYNQFTHDLGLNRLTEKISGKNPYYDSYEDYYIDIKTLSNDNLVSYGKIPEFKISDQVSELVGQYGGDATKIVLQEYLDDSQFNYKSSIDRDNNGFANEDTIKIVVDSVKKLLPYNGFYPQDRSLQLVNYLKKSYLDTNAIGGGLLLTSKFGGGEHILREQTDKLVNFSKENAFLEPLYAPGMFYNLIKSGIAVDWSVYTGSLPTSSFLMPLSEKPQFKISFESLLNLQDIPLSSSNDIAENRIIKYKEVENIRNSEDYPGTTSSSFQAFFEKLGEGSPLYTLSINNFLAETINFFLKDSSLNTFISKPDSDFLSFDGNKTYYMDIVLRKNDITMCEAHSSSIADSFGKMSGRYFGPSFWTGSIGDKNRIIANGLLSEGLRDPGYCAYTPPYFYGDSIARISFKPAISAKYTLDDIFQEMEIEFMNTGFMNDNIYPSGSLYSSFVMPLESSIKIKGLIEDRQQTVQLETSSRNFPNIVRNNLQNLVGTATNSTGIKRWVISPKMETPVLDFSNQEFTISTTILTQSRTDLELKTFFPEHTPPTASGFGRGMWSGYGEIPQGDKGIFFQLKESYPRQLSRVFDPITRRFEATNTASLLQACGFQQTNGQLSKKIGEIADSRDISEAIVIIPYLLNSPIGRPIDFGGRFSAKATNNIVQIEGHNFIGIDQKLFDYQKTNLFANKPAVSLQDYDLGVGNIQETSISRMIGLMSKYVLPPNFDFLINDSISPFVMYIAEFTSNLDKQDLADVWQGVMPKIAMRAEREKQIISHKNTQFDFFHGQGLPKDVKFMIFKAKKRAEINYYKMTSDSSDDGLFPSIQAGKPPSPYSFNWPYDYCSLVETATVNVEIEYLNNSGSNT